MNVGKNHGQLIELYNLNRTGFTGPVSQLLQDLCEMLNYNFLHYKSTQEPCPAKMLCIKPFPLLPN